MYLVTDQSIIVIEDLPSSWFMDYVAFTCESAAYLSFLALPHHPLGVLLILFANEFEQLRVWLQRHFCRNRPGLRVDLWIINDHLQIHMPEITTPEPLGKMKSITGGVARLVQPRSAVKAGCIHDERFSLPSADRKSLPCRPIHNLRKRPAVCEDLSECGPRLIQDQGQPRNLHDLQRSR